MIKLQSSEGNVFQVDLEIAKVSVTIKTMIENLGIEDDNTEIIPLPNVKARILKKVIRWATHHKDDPPPSEDDEEFRCLTDNISNWDMDFLKQDLGTLFELIMAANYLEIKSLLEVTCKTIAIMTKNKSLEEMREIFNIKNDFTAAEEEQLYKDNDWGLFNL